MYILFGIIGMIILGAFNAWVDVWMLGGFILGIVIYGLYYIIKNAKLENTSGADTLGGCLLFAVIAGILEGL